MHFTRIEERNSGMDRQEASITRENKRKTRIITFFLFCFSLLLLLPFLFFVVCAVLLIENCVEGGIPDERLASN